MRVIFKSIKNLDKSEGGEIFKKTEKCCICEQLFFESQNFSPYVTKKIN